MELLESIFLGMFLLGFLFTLISAVMSGAFGHAFGEGSAFDAHADAPGHMGGDVGPTTGEESPEGDGGFAKRLRDSGYLTRDGRMKERKKYGKKGARKSFQFSKR